jgi:hypothetical protein
MKRRSLNRAAKTGPRNDRLYTLEVFIFSGPVTEDFVKQNPAISRTIQIQGRQTLEDLHHAIFAAFDREEERMCEFQFGKGPNDPKAKRYVLPVAIHNPLSEGRKPAGSVRQTRIDSLDLKVDQAFGYWFDSGDDWWHQINVIAIDEKAPRGKYPRVTERVGESPPQYAAWDGED